MLALWATLVTLALAIVPAAADRTLELKEMHRAGKESPRLELISWNCTKTSAKLVTVEGQVKNIAGGDYAMRSWSAYIEVLDKDEGIIGSSGKPLQKDLMPEQKSFFRGQIDIGGGVPASCRIDFGDEDRDYKPWRASTSR